jgi:hypothetical protein
MTAQLNEAWAVLGDPDRRKHYDCDREYSDTSRRASIIDDAADYLFAGFESWRSVFEKEAGVAAPEPLVNLLNVQAEHAVTEIHSLKPRVEQLDLDHEQRVYLLVAEALCATVRATFQNNSRRHITTYLEDGSVEALLTLYDFTTQGKLSEAARQYLSYSAGASQLIKEMWDELGESPHVEDPPRASPTRPSFASDNTANRPSSYLYWAIGSVLLFWPLAIIAICNSIAVRREWEAGNKLEAHRRAAKAKNWTITTVVVGIIGVVGNFW